jgi:hypothetical protein
MPPGWHPAAAGGPAWHKPHFDVSRVQRFDPPMSRAAQAFVFVNFVVVLAGATALLWYADALPFPTLAAAGLATLAVLWTIGAVMQGRLAIGTALAIELGVALLASAVAAAP